MRQWFSRNKSRIQKWFMATLLLAIVIALVAYGINKRDSIEPGDVMQIMILVALVVVTGAYAWSASRQADASVKMGEEMRKQRYDMVRPVIIFLQDPMEERKFRLRNIGLGPAINPYLIIAIGGNTQFEDFDPIEINEQSTYVEITESDFNKLANESALLTARYQNVYEGCFQSSREVRVENGRWEKGSSLNICKISKDEYQRGKEK